VVIVKRRPISTVSASDSISEMRFSRKRSTGMEFSHELGAEEDYMVNRSVSGVPDVHARSRNLRCGEYSIIDVLNRPIRRISSPCSRKLLHDH
jgi:hypothetical protein